MMYYISISKFYDFPVFMFLASSDIAKYLCEKLYLSWLGEFSVRWHFVHIF
jgi:hypothetical protein